VIAVCDTLCLCRGQSVNVGEYTKNCPELRIICNLPYLQLLPLILLSYVSLIFAARIGASLTHLAAQMSHRAIQRAVVDGVVVRRARPWGGFCVCCVISQHCHIGSHSGCVIHSFVQMTYLMAYRGVIVGNGSRRCIPRSVVSDFATYCVSPSNTYLQVRPGAVAPVSFGRERTTHFIVVVVPSDVMRWVRVDGGTESCWRNRSQYQRSCSVVLGSLVISDANTR